VDWSEFYPDAVNLGEAIPSNAPKPLGIAVQLNLSCDESHSHATELIARLPTIGILFFLYGAHEMVLVTSTNTLSSHRHSALS
jgi:hypothetical protein